MKQPNKPSKPQHAAAPASRRGKKKVNWKRELANAGKTSGKVVGRFFSVLLNVFLTILLVGLIVGCTVGCVFALYIKNNVDPTLDVDLYVSDQDLTTMLYYINEDGVAVELEQ